MWVRFVCEEGLCRTDLSSMTCCCRKSEQFRITCKRTCNAKGVSVTWGEADFESQPVHKIYLHDLP